MADIRTSRFVLWGALFILMAGLILRGVPPVAFAEGDAVPPETAPQEVAPETPPPVGEDIDTASQADDTGGQAVSGEDTEPAEDGTPAEVLPPEGDGSASGTVQEAGAGTEGTEYSSSENPGTETPGADGDAGPGGSGSLIATGNAAAAVNILNVVNTTIVGSQGLFEILNAFAPILGDIDLRSFGLPDAPCCAGSDLLSVGAENAAGISNTVSVVGETGENSVAVGDLGSASIWTGGASAAANVVNIVNSNFVGSNYLLFVMNSFNGFSGDLVLPGKDFFSAMMENAGLPGAGGSLDVSNDNSSIIQNNVSVGAVSGGNDIVGADSGAIVTGDANAAANTVTVANTNLTGGTPVFILVRYFGEWTGNVFSTPPGISWRETPQGILLYDSSNSAVFSTESQSACCGNPDTLNVENNNAAAITNNVHVFALTGENKIEGGDDAAIVTGDANAAANVLNIANTNVVGRNWILAIVNIFGNWNGNLAFGRPDLWIGERAEVTANPLRPRNAIRDTLDIANRGDADATDVVVDVTFSQDGQIAIIDYGGGEQTDHGLRWRIPRIASGETLTLRYDGNTTDALPGAPSVLAVQASITSYEEDANPRDNGDRLLLNTLGYPRYLGPPKKVKFSRGPGFGLLPEPTMTKTTNVSSSVTAGSLVHYTIEFQNAGEGSIYGATLHDVLYNPYGRPVTTNDWELDDINPHEKLVMEYDNEFTADAPSGWYVNRAELRGRNFFRDAVLLVASSSVEIVNANPVEPPAPEPEGEVLGAAACGTYLTDYLRAGLPNHREQVTKLQEFLNEFDNANLPVTGVFGPLTDRAVRAFQARHAAEVLEPWETNGAMQFATGYVYKTTQYLINALKCPTLDVSAPALP